LELRQLRYFLRIVELGSMGKAAIELDLATAALSQQITKLENELGVILLQRSSAGTKLTEAGTSFYQSAQLVLRHADDAVRIAQRMKITGRVSIGLTPATLSALAMPFFETMKIKYPEVEVHIVESFSGYLSNMLNLRQLDLAVLFETESANSWEVTPLISEGLFALYSPLFEIFTPPSGLSLLQVVDLPLILPSKRHGFRRVLETRFAQRGLTPSTTITEVDSLSMLLELVRAGYGISIQQSAVTTRARSLGLSISRLIDPEAQCQNFLVNLPEKEMSPTAILAKTVLIDVVKRLVRERKWDATVLTKS
jgi:LysR family tcuABC transcriptional regulator